MYEQKNITQFEITWDGCSLATTHAFPQILNSMVLERIMKIQGTGRK